MARRLAARRLAARLGAVFAGAAVLGGCAPTMTARDFASFERSLVSEGRLRTDRAPADADVTDATLVENFGRIAFGLEPDLNEGRTETDLNRWAAPVRWQVFIDQMGDEPGKAVAEATATFARLAAATGLDIARTGADEKANFAILFLDRGDYEEALSGVAAFDPRIGQGIAAFRTSRLPCAGTVFTRLEPDADGPAGTFSLALVLIRRGFSDALRQTCLEEELAQSMGLRNDDPRVRPSIFNDDQEFARLTEHDQVLLGILYHPRLAPGMTRAEAMPLVPGIVAELRGAR